MMVYFVKCFAQIDCTEVIRSLSISQFQFVSDTQFIYSLYNKSYATKDTRKTQKR